MTPARCRAPGHGMQSVLVVSPHFPPVNAADHQRVRMTLPYLADFGWEATVLAVKPDAVEGMPIDAALSLSVPVEVQVEWVNALPLRATRTIGLGNLALRALPFLCAAGIRLLEEEVAADTAASTAARFDLVFFSTTQFPVMILGPIWKRKFGVPYVVDFQDPWLDDYYERTETPPPGGKVRYQLSRMLARFLEPRVMRDVSRTIAVSPSYVHTLQDRYPHLSTDSFSVLPFGAPEKDFELLPGLKLKQSVFDLADGCQHWVYVGAAGIIMSTALRLLFHALGALRLADPNEWNRIHLHFAGTSYAPAGQGRPTVQPIAEECGVGDLVEEQTDRRPYFETLQALTEADALLVIGSDSPSYTASKLYPYVLAKKPMLSILHEQSPAVEIVRKCQAGELVTFDPVNPDASAENMRTALRELLRVTTNNREPKTDNPTPLSVNWAEFNQYTAREMTRRMCRVFDQAVGKNLEQVLAS